MKDKASIVAKAAAQLLGYLIQEFVPKPQEVMIAYRYVGDMLELVITAGPINNLSLSRSSTVETLKLIKALVKQKCYAEEIRKVDIRLASKAEEDSVFVTPEPPKLVNTVLAPTDTKPEPKPVLKSEPVSTPPVRKPRVVDLFQDEANGASPDASLFEWERNILRIKDVVLFDDPFITIMEVCGSVCGGVSVKEIMSDNREQRLVLPRRLAMYMAHRFQLGVYEYIASKFNRDDHATVMHARKQVLRDLAKEGSKYRALLEKCLYELARRAEAIRRQDGIAQSSSN